jgi:hypothetical protein
MRSYCRVILGRIYAGFGLIPADIGCSIEADKNRSAMGSGRTLLQKTEAKALPPYRRCPDNIGLGRGTAAMPAVVVRAPSWRLSPKTQTQVRDCPKHLSSVIEEAGPEALSRGKQWRHSAGADAAIAGGSLPSGVEPAASIAVTFPSSCLHLQCALEALRCPFLAGHEVLPLQRFQDTQPERTAIERFPPPRPGSTGSREGRHQCRSACVRQHLLRCEMGACVSMPRTRQAHSFPNAERETQVTLPQCANWLMRSRCGLGEGMQASLGHPRNVDAEFARDYSSLVGAVLEPARIGPTRSVYPRAIRMAFVATLPRLSVCTARSLPEVFEREEGGVALQELVGRGACSARRAAQQLALRVGVFESLRPTARLPASLRQRGNLRR